MAVFDGYSTPDVIVEIGWSVDDPDDPVAPAGFIVGTSAFDLTSFGSDSTQWTANDDVIAVELKRGRDKRNDEINAGTMTVTLENYDGQYDPTNPSSPLYASGGVRPMRQIRVRAVTADGTSYNMFRGFIEDYVFDMGNDPTVQLDCTDVLARLAVEDLLELDDPIADGDRTDVRIGRILDQVGWDADARDLAVGNTTMAATKWGDNALAELQVAEYAEQGTVLATPDGKVGFRNNRDTWERTKSINVQLTLSDDLDHTAGLLFDSVEVEYGVSQIINSSSQTRVDYGDPATAIKQTAEDASSIGEFTRRSEDKSDVAVQSDSAALALGQFRIAQTKDPELRVRAITINALAQSGFWPQLLGLDIRDRIRYLRHYTSTFTFDRDLLLEGIEHKIDRPGLTWDVTFHTSDLITQADPFIVETSSFDGPDVIVY